jgi:serine/threonine-protein kinase
MISLKGQGRSQHLPTAFKWIKKAAEKEFPEAEAVLGNMYQNGDADGGENLDEAVRWFTKAAEQNNARGQFWLGKAYEKGVSNVLKKDVRKAGDLYRLAKTQDFPGAAEALEALRKSGKY